MLVRSSPGDDLAFGGPHAISFCISFADGAATWIRFDTDPAIHMGLCNSQDDVVIPGNAIR